MGFRRCAGTRRLCSTYSSFVRLPRLGHCWRSSTSFAMNRDKSRTFPRDAPLEWINQRWRPYVVTDDGIDRRSYELCALTEFKNRLRSGDVWVAGSRQFKDFDAYLLEPSRFAELRAQQNSSLSVEHNGDIYVAGRVALLEQSLDEVDGLAARGELPDAAVSESGLKMSPLTNAVPDEASVLMRRAYALLPHIKITDLLLEVDRWTGFSKHFTHLKTGEPAKDQLLLLTAILADGINLGISKMAEACPGTTARKLDWLASLHIGTTPIRRHSPSWSTIIIGIHSPNTGKRAQHRRHMVSVSAPAGAESSPGRSISATGMNRTCSFTPTSPTNTHPSI